MESSAEANTVTCNGPCGRTVPALCASTSGLFLNSGSDLRYWFCDRCQLKLCPLNWKRCGGPDDGGTRKVIKVSEELLDPSVLPPEMWTEIFSELSPRQLLQVRLVCRHWRDIVDGSGSLKDKLTVIFTKSVTIEQDYQPVHLLPVHGANFKSSKIASVGSWWPPFGNNLVEVSFSSCKVSLPNLLEMLKHAPNLQILELLYYDETCERPDPANFRLDKVEKLTLDGRNITQLSEVFLDVCRNLKSLRLTWNFYGNHDDCVKPLEMAKFVGNLRNTLEELYINSSDEIVTELLKLDGLKLKKVALLDDPVDYKLLVQLYQKNPALEYLDIHEVVDLGFIVEKIRNEMVHMLPNLKHLSINVGPYFGADLTCLANFTKLQSLALYGYQEHNISAYAFDLPDGGMPNLKELYLEGIYFPYNRLQQFLAKTPNVHTLIIEYENLFDTWSDFLTAIGTLKLLQKLSIDMITFKKSTRCPFQCLPTLNVLNMNLGAMPPSLANMVLGLCPHLRDFHVNSISNSKSTINDEVLRVILNQLCKVKLEHAK
ncbi:hypothetical protein quinque_007414 [Culex quinquefasciatus]